MKRIVVNPKNNSGEWWEAARADANIPTSIAPLLEAGGPGEVVVEDAEAAHVVIWAAQFHGWTDGPDDAPPLLVQDAR